MMRAPSLATFRRPSGVPFVRRRPNPTEGWVQEALFAAALLIGLGLFALGFRWALGLVGRLVLG